MMVENGCRSSCHVSLQKKMLQQDAVLLKRIYRWLVTIGRPSCHWSVHHLGSFAAGQVQVLSAAKIGLPQVARPSGHGAGQRRMFDGELASTVQSPGAHRIQHRVIVT